MNINFGHAAEYAAEKLVFNSTSMIITVITILAVILAILAAVLIELLVVRVKGAKGGLKKFQDIVTGKSGFFPIIMRILWIFATVYVIISSFAMIPINFGLFIVQLVVAPVIIRAIYEFAMSVYEIRDKLSK